MGGAWYGRPLLQSAGDEALTVDELLVRAYQARRGGRLADAEWDMAQAVDLSRQAESPIDLAKALTGLGQVERDLGRRKLSRGRYEEAAAIYRTGSNKLKLAHAVRHLGDIQQELGRPDLAAPCYQEALQIYRTHSHTPPLDLANAIRSFAIHKENVGEDAEARALWEEARDLYVAAGVEAAVDECLRRINALVQ